MSDGRTPKKQAPAHPVAAKAATSAKRATLTIARAKRTTPTLAIAKREP